MGLHRAQENLDVAKRENAAILMEDDYVKHYDGYDPDSPEGHIILSMYQNAFLEQSIMFADEIEKQFTDGLSRKSRGVKQAGFLVLRNTTMPSVLVETGFLSDDVDETFLSKAENRAKVAQAIFNAFAEYKTQIEGYFPDDNLVAARDSTPGPVAAIAVSAPSGLQQPSVRYYVQLAASKTPLSSQLADWKVPVFVETRHEDGYYRYLAGPFKEAGEAGALQKELRTGCCKDAFIVAYRDDKRISLKEAAAATQ